jgi:glycosyltransferase involved in cell wall biosynthesis
MSPDRPYFSVVVPTYNRAGRLGQAIESVLGQRLEDWELIIVDDASTDDTARVISTYHDRRIRCVRNERNIERSASRNRGIELARGRYVCFLDSDDYYLPNHLRVLRDAIATTQEEIALFYTDCERVSLLTGERRIVCIDVPVRTPVEHVIEHQIPCISVAVHSAILRELRFDDRLHVNEDVDLFARIVASYPAHRVRSCSVVAVTHGENTTHHVATYALPQLVAARIMFGRAEVRRHVSRVFVRRWYARLHGDAAFQHLRNGHFCRGTWHVVQSLRQAWRGSESKNLLAHWIYSAPGGGLLKAGVRRVRSARARRRARRVTDGASGDRMAR